MTNELSAEILKKTLGEKLSLLRQESGETIEEAAFGLGLDASDYFKFLKGKRLPHLLTLMRISQKYGVELNWWFNESDKISKSKTQIKNKMLEIQMARIISKLDPRMQKAALAMLKASVKNLMSISRN